MKEGWKGAQVTSGREEAPGPWSHALTLTQPDSVGNSDRRHLFSTWSGLPGTPGKQETEHWKFRILLGKLRDVRSCLSYS